MAETVGIAGFSPIAERVSLYQPEQVGSLEVSKQGAPSLLVYCSWMGATPQYIGKYIEGYQRMFPETPILLVQSEIYDTFGCDAFQAKRLGVACDKIIESAESQTSPGPIYLHAQSSGGGSASTRIARLFTKRGKYNIFSKLILDCLPGAARKEQCVQAIAMSLPKSKIAKVLGTWLIRVYIHTANFINVKILGGMDLCTTISTRLNDPNLFDPNTTQKLFMYTKADHLIDHELVHELVEVTREKGWKGTKEVVFEKAAHCALVREDPKKYWGAIKDFIDE